MDEYTSAHLKATHLNMIADGTYMYPVKGEDSMQKAVIVVICGNRHPEDVYPKAF